MDKLNDLKSSLHISIPSQLLAMFNEHSKEQNKSRNQIIAELIFEWIEDQEDIKLAEEVMKKIKEGDCQTISHEEMMKRLG